jgi:hypothetical protein
MKTGGWSMEMGTPGERKKKRNGNGQSDGIFGVRVAVGEIRIIGYKFLFLSLFFFPFSFNFDVIFARFDPPKRALSASL